MYFITKGNDGWIDAGRVCVQRHLLAAKHFLGLLDGGRVARSDDLVIHTKPEQPR